MQNIVHASAVGYARLMSTAAGLKPLVLIRELAQASKTSIEVYLLPNLLLLLLAASASLLLAAIHAADRCYVPGGLGGIDVV